MKRIKKSVFVTTGSPKSCVSWNMTSCNLVDKYWRRKQFSPNTLQLSTKNIPRDDNHCRSWRSTMLLNLWSITVMTFVANSSKKKFYQETKSKCKPAEIRGFCPSLRAVRNFPDSLRVLSRHTHTHTHSTRTQARTRRHAHAHRPIQIENHVP